MSEEIMYNQQVCEEQTKYSENLDSDISDKLFNEEMDIEEHDVNCGNEECILNGRCNTNDLPAPSTLSDLIDGLHKIFAHQKINVDFVRNYMSMYKSNHRDWRKFAKFDQHRYTRNLVDEGNGRFNLMILCWNEAQGSSIHSHANSHCFLKVIDGAVEEELFQWPTDSESEHAMTPVQIGTVKRNEVKYMCDELGLHRVSNPSHTDKAVTLHLYSPPFNECTIFDERTGHQQKAQTTFWSKFGKRTPFGKTGGQCTIIEAENN